jgi:hypothetical protein
MQHELSSSEHVQKMTPLQVKVELLRKSLEVTQKYELLTTNQYLNQMELLVEILQEVSVQADPRARAKPFLV